MLITTEELFHEATSELLDEEDLRIKNVFMGAVSRVDECEKSHNRALNYLDKILIMSRDDLLEEANKFDIEGGRRRRL